MVGVQEIKKKISCVDVAKRANLPITRTGDRCPSPFHKGTNSTSFVCFDDFWYSFSDAKGGDVIDLWAMLFENGDKGLAIKKLAASAGVKVQVDESWKEKIRALCNEVAYYNAQLRPEDYGYLHSRGLSDDTIRDRLLGYDGKGIVIPYWKNDYVYDYTVRRYEGEPRYKRSGKGLDKAPWGQHTLGRGDSVWLVEGSFDALALDQEGKAVLCSTNPELDTLRRFKTVILAYDNDEAGLEYTRKVALKLFTARIPFQMAEFPDKDLAEYYVDGGKMDRIHLRDGLEKLVSEFQELDSFRKFVCQAARSCDRLRLVELIDTGKQFTEKERKTIERIATSAPTESEIADEIIHGNDMVYIENVGFYQWDGVIWRRRSDIYIKSMADVAYGKFFATSVRCTAVCNTLKARLLTDANFNRKPVLTFTNGTLELDTGNFRAARSSDYCNFAMSYPYEPAARAELWEKFISDVADNDHLRIEALQQLAGYVLFPDCRHQKMFALIGDGGNGKSVYLEILQKLFGDENCSNVDPAGIVEDFQRIYLKDSLLNVGSEIDNDFSRAEKVLKKVAAGEEVTACYKGLNYVKFYPRCKLLYACNEMPRAEIIKGLDRRLVFIKFPCQFVEHPDPKNPLQKKRNLNIIPELLEELPGIFNWAFEGYKALISLGNFTETREQTEYMHSFKELSNPIVVFCEECPFEEMMTRDEIYTAYAMWCRDTGNKALSRQIFLPKFREVMGKRIKDESRRKIGDKQPFVLLISPLE